MPVPTRRRRDVRWLSHALRGPLRARERSGEDGFILLESLIAISLITVLMGALASLTINVVTGTNELRARQGAAQVATSAMAAISAVPASDLDEGTTTRFAATPQVLNSISYAISTTLTGCGMSSASPSTSSCVAGGPGTNQFRAVVTVTWNGRGCRPAAGCSYVTTTLVNDGTDPVFNTNRAVPPPKPTVVDPGDQTSTRGTAVSLQLAVTPGTGLAPFTWAISSGALPAGLTLSTDGLVTGSPTALVGATPLTVTVADVFGRSGSDTFSWSVVGPPTIATPASQSSAVGQSVSLTPTSTCPNKPCAFTLAGAPAGLIINASTGAITGSPTTAGTSSAVIVSVTDAAGATVSTSAFSWTILDPASVGSPGTLRTSVGAMVSVPVSYTCSAGPCTITLAGTAPGIGLSTTASVSTNNTTLSLTRPTGSGTIYLAGVPQPTAVTSGTSRAYAPTLRIVNSTSAGVTSAAGSWTVFAAPTLDAVGNRNATVGGTKDVAVAYTCPNVPCTVTLTGSVPGLGLSATSGRTTTNNTTALTLGSASGTVWISGLVSSSAVPSGSTSRPYPLSATITDGAGSSATSSGTWTATTLPKITNPGSQALEPNDDFNLQLAYECPNGGCTFYADAQIYGYYYQVPISSTGRITYNNAPAGTYSIRVIMADSEGYSTLITFPLTVQTFSLSIPNQATTRPSSGQTTVTLSVPPLVRPVADGYTYSVTGLPSWLTMDADGQFTGVITNSTSRTTSTITVKVTSTSDPASTVSSTFTWAVTR